MNKVLLIEDDETLRQLYRETLEDEQIVVSSSATAKDGLEKIQADKPDLIMLDIMLPGGMNGFDLLERIKKDPKYADIPVLVLTNLDTERNTAISMGAADYIVKANTSIDDVVKKVKSLLQPHNA
jgi:DNA-binding response OmpR family regulator